MSDKKATEKASPKLQDKIERITQSLLAMRRNQEQADAEFLASLGTLTSQQLNTLNIIGDNQPCPMSTISYITALPFSNATVIVDQLVRKKLVKRERGDKDRRVIYAQLTPKGTQIYNKQIEYMQMAVALVLATLSQEEQDLLAKFMERFAGTLK